MLRLVVGPLNYSSWSMRPWLVLHHAGAAVKTHEIPLFVGPDWQEQVLSFSGAGKVPVLVDKNLSIHESLAICEYVAELHPEAQLWPADRGLRARGRAISAEMASSFGALREAHAKLGALIERPSVNLIELAKAFTAVASAMASIARDAGRPSLRFDAVERALDLRTPKSALRAFVEG